MSFDYYEVIPSGSPLLNGQDLPDEEIVKEMTIDELEEEYARLTRQKEDLLAMGKSNQVQALNLRLDEIEDLIADLEES